MLIRSQDKRMIVNFDNICTVSAFSEKWIKFYWRKKLPCDNNGVLQRNFT